MGGNPLWDRTGNARGQLGIHLETAEGPGNVWEPARETPRTAWRQMITGYGSMTRRSVETENRPRIVGKPDRNAKVAEEGGGEQINEERGGRLGWERYLLSKPGGRTAARLGAKGLKNRAKINLPDTKEGILSWSFQSKGDFLTKDSHRGNIPKKKKPVIMQGGKWGGGWGAFFTGSGGRATEQGGRGPGGLPENMA